MVKRRKAKKSTGSLSMILEVIDVADATFEKITGKSISDWLKSLQEEGRADQIARQGLSAGTGTSPYTVLGLPDDVSMDQVKKRYRQLSMIFHPDREGGYGEAMKKVNEAYREIMAKAKGKT